MKARKANRVYSISVEEKKHYIDLGFDIYDDDGKKISNGAGKKVSQDEYDALQAKYDKMASEMEKLKKASTSKSKKKQDKTSDPDASSNPDVPTDPDAMPEPDSKEGE